MNQKKLGWFFNPVLEGDAVIIDGPAISSVGKEEEIKADDVGTVIDINGATVAPGLIDSHCHVCVGDYTPRQFAANFIEGELHGGVTTVISAGEVHYPGRPKDAAGTKALAILTAKAYANFRPGGVKVIGGGLILEKGLTEKDFKEMAKEDVTHVGETLGDMLGNMAREALGISKEECEGYGKGAIVGMNGELEHGHSILHPKLGAPFREALGGGKAIIPSAAKMGRPGEELDVPTHYKDAAFVRTHFDAMPVRVQDAPRQDEILVALVVTNAGRLLPRIGDLKKEEAQKEDGLR